MPQQPSASVPVATPSGRGVTRRRSAGAAVVALLGAAALLSGCGGSSSSSSAQSAPSTAATAAPAPTDVPSLSPGPVPPVQNATDLTKEPVIGKGTATPPSVLTGTDLVVGSGTEATPTSTVTVQYVGALYDDGTVFDSSWKRGAPATFPLLQVVKGFQGGIAGMKVGGRREIVIPPALGYGSQANGPIPANSTLVFVVDLLKVS
jgi:FKBP-type peptidyl-prolyl cis-trans isomerase